MVLIERVSRDGLPHALAILISCDILTRNKAMKAKHNSHEKQTCHDAHALQYVHHCITDPVKTLFIQKNSHLGQHYYT